jgi:hypothetical protein
MHRFSDTYVGGARKQPAKFVMASQVPKSWVDDRPNADPLQFVTTFFRPILLGPNVME